MQLALMPYQTSSQVLGQATGQLTGQTTAQQGTEKVTKRSEVIMFMDGLGTRAIMASHEQTCQTQT